MISGCKKMKCTVNGCDNELGEGDALFCRMCRYDWIGYCRSVGIHENDRLSKEVVNAHLKRFQIIGVQSGAYRHY